MVADGDGAQVSVEGAFKGQLVVGDNNVVVHSGGAAEVVVRHEPMPAPRPRSRPAGTPLPFDEPDLLGRAPDVDRVVRLLGERTPVQVTGPPGIGKSALLRAAGVRRQAAGTDVVHLAAAGMDVEDVLQELFQTCYDTRHYRPARPQLRRLMGTINALVLVDDFGGDADDLATLLDALPGCGVAVATPRRLPWDGETFELAGLGLDSAVELLVRETGRECSAEERRLAERFAGSVDGHPAALVQAGTALRSAAVEDVPADLDALAGALATGLGDTARDVLATLRAAEGVAVPPGLVAELTGSVGADAAGKALERLETAGLAAREGAGYSLCGPLAHKVTREDPPTEPGRRAAVLAAWARSASADEISAAGPLVAAVLETAVEGGHHAAARDLARAVAPALCLTLRWGAWRRVLALGRRASRSLRAAGDETYFDQQDRMRRKALAKGVLAGAAVGTALLAGKHLAGGTAAKGGAAGAKGAKGLLAKPAVLGPFAAVVVGGAIAAAGLGWTPASSSGDRPQASLSAVPSGGGNGGGTGNGSGGQGRNLNGEKPDDGNGNGGDGGGGNRGGSTCVAEQPKAFDFGSFAPRDDPHNPAWRTAWTFPVCDRRLDGPNWTIKGGEGRFHKAVDDTCGSAIVEPGNRCLLGLTFDPGPMPNRQYRASVVIPGLALSGGPAAPQEITLLGSTRAGDPATFNLTITGQGVIGLNRNGAKLGDSVGGTTTNLAVRRGDRIRLTPSGTVSDPGTGQPTWPSPCPAGTPGDQPCEFVVGGDASMTVAFK
ncbi:hypothetical protein [Actinomadura sp. 9N215]|uniref:hypothetical protein n=1 Tax=Actinomadura sp. 9N215 TaxID=3375150 RepID=UPI00379599B8